MLALYYTAGHKLIRWALIPLGLALLAAGCGQPGESPWRSTGSYPIDIFQEMHYNQSFKSQEPPRLYPPPDSVPVTGKELPLPALKTDAQGLENPVGFTSAAQEQAGVLYHINCAVCHGPTSQGDSFVGQQFVNHGATEPPSFASERIQLLTDGEAFWSITRGFGFMPTFGALLKPEQRWLLVHLISMPADQREALLGSTKAPGY